MSDKNKIIPWPKRKEIDPAVKRMVEMIKWTEFQEGHLVLVGEFQIVGKHDFQEGATIGKRKMAFEKEAMAEDLLNGLREMIK